MLVISFNDIFCYFLSVTLTYTFENRNTSNSHVIHVCCHISFLLCTSKETFFEACLDNLHQFHNYCRKLQSLAFNREDTKKCLVELNRIRKRFLIIQKVLFSFVQCFVAIDGTHFHLLLKVRTWSIWYSIVKIRPHPGNQSEFSFSLWTRHAIIYINKQRYLTNIFICDSCLQPVLYSYFRSSCSWRVRIGMYKKHCVLLDTVISIPSPRKVFLV